MNVLSIDPGINSCGAALWVNGKLVDCDRFQVSKAGKTQLQRAVEVANDIVAWVLQGYKRMSHVDEVCFEWPQVYRASKSKGDPNDLLPLVAVGSVVCGLQDEAKHFCYLPREWIGQLPKVTSGSYFSSPRGLRILGRLDSAERKLVPDQNDVGDAVGIGLYHLGRLKIQRICATGR